MTLEHLGGPPLPHSLYWHYLSRHATAEPKLPPHSLPRLLMIPTLFMSRSAFSYERSPFFVSVSRFSPPIAQFMLLFAPRSPLLCCVFFFFVFSTPSRHAHPFVNMLLEIFFVPTHRDGLSMIQDTCSGSGTLLRTHSLLPSLSTLPLNVTVPLISSFLLVFSDVNTSR